MLYKKYLHFTLMNYLLTHIGIHECISSGVARGVAGVAEATPIIQFLFNKFGQKIRVKRYRIYCGLHQFQNPTYLPDND